ncbi:MAG: hypothetical protein MZV49_12745 [Rhodopseudomonas palustris]|nr:hypothetical protein [Rhodopseudomonas palustris]
MTYVLYPDEGHGFARPENRTSFYAISEGFLAQLPRRPLRTGRQRLRGLEPAGAGGRARHVPGLVDALAKSPK